MGGVSTSENVRFSQKGAFWGEEGGEWKANGYTVINRSCNFLFTTRVVVT
jgi:hypothetical protein